MQNNEVKVCPRCKHEINYYEKTCIYCGEEFEVEYPDERAAYIQKNVGTYLRKFDKIRSDNSDSSWNWCAFLFTFDWLIYRKMYKLAIITLVCLFALEFVAGFIGLIIVPFENDETLADLLIAIVDIAVCVVIGIKGDKWYKAKVDKLVEESAEMSSEEKQEHYKKGGTNLPAVIIIVLISGAISLLLG